MLRNLFKAICLSLLCFSVSLAFCLILLFLGIFSANSAFGQSIPGTTTLRLEQLPGYDRYSDVMKNRGAIRNIGRVKFLSYSEDGNYLNFEIDNQTKSLNLNTLEIVAKEKSPSTETSPRPRGRRPSTVPRAQQRAVEPSPDGKWNAVYRDNNVFIESTTEGVNESIQVTSNGTDRLRYGTGCWVYGEELSQKEAMWWSPDGKLLVFYEVDEQGLKDYYLTTQNSQTYTNLLVTRYPKAGEENPQVNLMVYSRETGETKRLSIDGEPRQYLFNIRFTPAGDELLVNRTNRDQNVLDVLAINPQSGATRVVVSENQATWQENSPNFQFLSDGQRFIWETEANGWKNYQLRHLDGRLINALTNHSKYPCEKIVLIDEKQGYFYYTAYSDSLPYNEQLHRVNLDGTQDVRLTSSPLHHSSFDIDPQHRFILAVREQVDIPPVSVVYDSQGKEVAVLADGSQSPNLPATKTPELISFPSTDGTTQLFGTLHFPTDFDPNKTYPLLVDVYGGPQSRGFSNAYQPTQQLCELGFVVAKIANRGTAGRGKAFESAIYQTLGKLDLDDQVAGVNFITQRNYIDKNRVGIYGHSYGGYMSALAILRYPEVFQVAVAGAPVTDWRQYDSIYTERYMRTPQLNTEGYDQGSCMKYAEDLQGKLLIVHGLIDDNVHPANSWELIEALQKADKRFDLMIYPGFKHGIASTYTSVRIEYLYHNLIGNVATNKD